MTQVLDPLADPRWRDLVDRHPRASAFHTPQWLEALRRTYGFVPRAYASEGADLGDAILFCGVTSWLTGRRLVSLPFSDHCEPLVDGPERLRELLGDVATDARRGGWRYVQVRPRSATVLVDGFERDEDNWLYTIDLARDHEAIFAAIKKNNRYDIRRAERSGLRPIVGRDRTFVRAYFRLHAMTRSTQGVPPQPYTWFENLADCLGDMIEIHLLLDGDTPIAGLVTIRFRDQLMLKYSASDPLRDRLGMGKSLVWRSICDAKERGATTLDWGRCEPDNAGLAQFKERFGAVRSELVYLRSPGAAPKRERSSWVSTAARRVVPRLPIRVLTAAGRVAYRHVA
ncbi:MAG TPA: GNAT family N-acetyltransferase [Candidatus Limnocylindria bacterium]|nr:GNAT family N-acetyltransferase [Candidatus Limnocylindria bacterium]